MRNNSVNRKTNLYLNKVKSLTLSLALYSVAAGPATAAGAGAVSVSEIEPEIVASSWSDETSRSAAVTFNGKELFRFNAASDKIGEIAIEDKAEDLASKLDQLVKSKKFNPDKLYPVKTKDGVILKTDGIDLLKFSNSELVNSTILGQSALVDCRELDPKAAEAKSLEYGLKLTNAIRTAFGVKALPMSFLKLAELTARHSLDDLTAIAKATEHFSGNASWYGPHFHGHKTSDGHIFNQDGLTAAHRSLPFGTKLLVTNRRTGDSCVVKVNDRGPFIGGRVIDLSKGAARQLNMLGSGVAMVDCIVIGR
jgi:rare lipoprotein A